MVFIGVNSPHYNSVALLENPTSQERTSHCKNSLRTGGSALKLQKGIAIASLNVNGLRSHLDEVQLLVHDLGIHILALNETKFDPNYPKEFTAISGYQQERQERTFDTVDHDIHCKKLLIYGIQERVSKGSNQPRGSKQR